MPRELSCIIVAFGIKDGIYNTLYLRFQKDIYIITNNKFKLRQQEAGHGDILLDSHKCSNF